MSDSLVPDTGGTATTVSTPVVSDAASGITTPQPQSQPPMGYVPARFKEAAGSAFPQSVGGQENAVAPSSAEEAAVLERVQTQVSPEASTAAVEFEKNPEIPLEVEAWMQEVGQHEVQVSQQVKIHDTTPIHAMPIEPPQTVVVLPVTKKVIDRGIHARFSESVRWLSHWCLRIMKKFHGMVVYRE